MVLKHCYKLNVQESKPKQGLKAPGAGLVTFWWTVVKMNDIFTNVKETSDIFVRPITKNYQHFKTCMSTYKNASSNMHKLINPPKDTYLPIFLCPDKVHHMMYTEFIKGRVRTLYRMLPKFFTALQYCKIEYHYIGEIWGSWSKNIYKSPVCLPSLNFKLFWLRILKILKVRSPEDYGRIQQTLTVQS